MIALVRYMPGTDLAGRIRAYWHKPMSELEMALVSIPHHSHATMEELARDVQEAEWELDAEIWINGYF